MQAEALANQTKCPFKAFACELFSDRRRPSTHPWLLGDQRRVAPAESLADASGNGFQSLAIAGVGGESFDERAQLHFSLAAIADPRLQLGLDLLQEHVCISAHPSVERVLNLLGAELHQLQRAVSDDRHSHGSEAPLVARGGGGVAYLGLYRRQRIALVVERSGIYRDMVPAHIVEGLVADPADPPILEIHKHRAFGASLARVATLQISGVNDRHAAFLADHLMVVHVAERPVVVAVVGERDPVGGRVGRVFACITVQRSVQQTDIELARFWRRLGRGQVFRDVPARVALAVDTDPFHDLEGLGCGGKHADAFRQAA